MLRLRLLTALLATLLAGAGAAQDAAPARLTITVRDRTTGAPVANARIDLAGVSRPLRTGRDGVAEGEVPAATRIVTVSRLGYLPQRLAIEFRAGEAVARTVQLTPTAVEVAGLEVEAAPRDGGLERHGFYQRQRMGMGAFMDGDRIWEIRPTRSIELFRRMRGFAVTTDRRGRLFIHTTRGTCNSTPLVFVDGMLVATRSSDLVDMIDMVNPEQIAGIEAYSGPATIPPQYNVTGSACGVVLIWTRT